MSEWKSPSEKSGQPEFKIQEVYNILKGNLKPITAYDRDSVLDQCKYVRLARRHNYENYKLLLYRDLRKFNLLGSFSYYQLQFFADSGATVAIFNEMNGCLISIVFRKSNEKEFMNYSLTQTIYGYDMLNSDFKYGDWVIITEGIYDADVLRQVYPNVVATLTSNVTVMQSEVLKLMSNRFIIAYDSDDAGDSGFTKALNRLDGCTVKKLPIFPGDKDAGIMEEKLEVSHTDYQLRYEFYSQKLNEVMNDTSEGFFL